MEELAAAMRDMTASMNAVKTTVDESQTILREIGTWKPQVDGALQEMCSDITTLVSADTRIEPAMDPFDRAIAQCEHILAMLSQRVMQPEDSGVDQELADSCDNATSSPDGAMPAKCSTLVLSPNVGGVEAVESSQQSGIVSTVSPRPVGALPPLTMQQFGIFKPDASMPTTCSTEVLAIDINTKCAKLSHLAVQATAPSTTSPTIRPWDPGLQLRQTAPDTSPFQPGLGDLPTSFPTWEEEPQLHAHFPRAPAWGQAGIEEGGNVTTLPTPTKQQA